MKKFLSLFLSIVMMLSITAGLDFSAYAAVSGDYEYTISNGTAEITKYTGNAAELKIPSEIKGYQVTSIGESAFEDCSSLTSITIPDSVTSIGEYAFGFCNSLTSITIPGSVTSIGYSAFDGCSSLTSITIPDSVTYIGDGAFSYCDSLTSIVVNENNKEYSSLDGVLFDKDKTLLEQYPGGNENASYTIPDSVTSIGNYAFGDCSSLTSITIPNSVTSIGESAFDGCSSLKSIAIPDGVTSIGRMAFCNCRNLTSITIPDSVTSIGDSAFECCIGLTSITIPDGVTRIGIQTFFDCNSLTSITIPNSVTSIGVNAFCGCSNLTSITIPDSVTSIGDSAFGSCSSLTSITIPDSVTSIGYDAFGWCNNLEKIVIRSFNCNIADDSDIGYAVDTIPRDTVIHGYAGSTAQAYAEKCGNSFVEIKRVDALGGSIRITDAGLRFGFSYNESKNVNVEEYGFVYSYSETNDLTVDTVGAKKRVADKRVTNENNVTTFNLVFTGIPKSAYDTVISARAYVKIDGQYYYSDILQRSFNIVANAVLADETIDQSIKDKINDLLNKEA